MNDQRWLRESVYRSGAGRIAHRTINAAPAPGLAGYDALDDHVARAARALRACLGAAGREGDSFELTVASERSELRRPDLSSLARAELTFVARVIVRGPRSRVPVLWQRAGFDDPVPAFEAALDATIRPEIEACVTGDALSAPMRCPLVLDPWLASQFIHECVGHTSEADNYLAYARPAGLELGHRWCDYPLQVFDDPTMEGCRASYDVDLDGAPARRAQLVEDGVWRDLLVDRQHQEKLCWGAAGSGRRVFGATRTLPRMSVTYAGAGDASLDELIDAIPRGIYCIGTWGGGSAGLGFVLRPAYGRWIEGGRLTERVVRRFDIVGDKLSAVAAITGASRDLRFFNPARGCDKSGQDGLAVTSGAPHLRLSIASIRPIERSASEGGSVLT